ncbi:SMP-30/gluconolactonase/LRE family protein [Microbulbifer halophilus]|uniref:SMP-30/gluconolactonase/LRE family protein n=1 Tax=Microbulbifer halophilus TaxID=453963 RepID=A0ABW5EC35_9GAMM|nr:SMP-30/gluconolactonase/LRE family protein [Microbulbifer halophilus]MCW8125730.1 SMP-30/gluconolactonase/LRE family protein [Microbulbifer halophilus]
MKRTLLLLATLLGACAETPQSTEDWVAEHRFTDGVEGPAIDAMGNLYAVNLGRRGTIGIVRGKDREEIFAQLPAGSTGNSLRFDSDGFMLVADYTGHNILKLDPQSGELVQQFHNDRMHQPNDIAIAADGTVYASDPDWQNGSGQLWKMDADGHFTLLEADMGTTNGIELSTDGQRLYVNESVQRKVYVYDIQADGNIANKRLLMEFADHGLDGMAADAGGNLYIARYGAGEVLKIAPDGERLSSIGLKGQHPTNIALSRDGKRAFVTMQKRGNIESFTIDQTH